MSIIIIIVVHYDGHAYTNLSIFFAFFYLIAYTGEIKFHMCSHRYKKNQRKKERKKINQVQGVINSVWLCWKCSSPLEEAGWFPTTTGCQGCWRRFEKTKQSHFDHFVVHVHLQFYTFDCYFSTILLKCIGKQAQLINPSWLFCLKCILFFTSLNF